MLDPAEILRVLAKHDVAFIVVGGMAAVMQGVPVTTADMDIVYQREARNIVRLEAALIELEAVFRTDPRRLRPNSSHLESPGHKLLQTKHGILDVLGTIEENTQYEALLPDTDVLTVHELQIRTLTLERLISVKEKLTRPKDQLMLLQLKATLSERSKLG